MSLFLSPTEKKFKQLETLRFYEEKYKTMLRLINKAPEAAKPDLFLTARHYKNMISKFRKDLGYE